MKTRSAAVEQWSGLLDFAASRWGLPSAWLQDVMRLESNGNAFAVSPKGAIGLMQVMPTTYAALRPLLGLGSDPFLPRDNVLAGAMYLRLLVDRYGWPGALTAYNAGPARLDALLTHSRALPTETLAYLARFAAMHADKLGGEVPISGSTFTPTASAQVIDPLPQATIPTLFVPPASTPSAAPAAGATASADHRGDAAKWRESGLFVSTTDIQTH